MGSVGFAVGTGRCGTKFLAEVLSRDPQIAAHHERHAFSDTFHRYCQWYGIPLDEAGFIAVKRRAIAQDLARHAYSFEASAFLALSLETLHRALGVRIVIMVRRPERVVASYLRKGWYETEPDLDDASLPPSMQNVERVHHFLGRTMPRGDEFARWRGLTRVGKIAWFWSTLNRALLQQSQRLPGACVVQRLEDLNYPAFRKLITFLGAPDHVTAAEFSAVKRRRPNAAHGIRTVHQWSAVERAEFEAEVRELAEHFGYVWSTAALAEEPAPQPAPRWSPRALLSRKVSLPWVRPA
jgi:hypothetical protein